MNILIFAGSTRHNSFNHRLAINAAKLAEGLGATPTLLALSDFDIPMYNADEEAQGTPPDVIRLKQLMLDHPAWLICTPEYNGSYPALLKNTIDWASSPVKGDPVWGDGVRAFRNKVVGVLSASPGGLGGLRAQSHLVPLLINLGCWVSPTAFAVGGAGGAFAEDHSLTNPAHTQGVTAVIQQTLWAAERLSA